VLVNLVARVLERLVKIQYLVLLLLQVVVVVEIIIQTLLEQMAVLVVDVSETAQTLATEPQIKVSRVVITRKVEMTAVAVAVVLE
jgi:hypothetical protein